MLESIKEENSAKVLAVRNTQSKEESRPAKFVIWIDVDIVKKRKINIACAILTVQYE